MIAMDPQHDIAVACVVLNGGFGDDRRGRRSGRCWRGSGSGDCTSVPADRVVVASFFDRFLKGHGEHLLDGGQTGYPINVER
ncbi:MAG: hypothetical protein HOV87_05950 [Catenulispora sp.]|nr:hypothetical protein [Catenulispora sp.]